MRARLAWPIFFILLFVYHTIVLYNLIYILVISGGDLIHDFRGTTKDYVLSELERRKGELRTQLVWIGAQKEPGYTSRTWKWVNGMICIPFFHIYITFILFDYFDDFDEMQQFFCKNISIK